METKKLVCFFTENEGILIFWKIKIATLPIYYLHQNLD